MFGLGTGITCFDTPDSPALEAGNSYLELWLKFNTGITESGNDVSKWADQSGNENHALQTTSARQPVLDTNRLAFNAAGSDEDQRLDLTSEIVLQEFTIIASLEISLRETMGLIGKASDDCLRFHQGGDFDRISLLLPSTTDEDADMLNLTADIPHRTKFIFSMTKAAGPDDNVIVRFDGSDVTDTNTGRNDSDSANTFTVADVGTAAGNFANWRGYISEMAIFKTALSDDDLTRIENEISTRTGV